MTLSQLNAFLRHMALQKRRGILYTYRRGSFGCCYDVPSSLIFPYITEDRHAWISSN